MPYNPAYQDDIFFRIMDRVLVGDDCWIWTGALNSNGYGVISDKMIRVRTHRVVYERMVGPIPDEMVLDHLCQTPACVRPAHLEAVTQRENLRRSADRRTHCPQGHPYDEKNTYRYTSGVRKCRACRNEQQKRYYRAQTA